MTVMVKGRILGMILIMAVGAVFWVMGWKALDPDFGWHLRMGEIIRTSGIPKTDPFSYTMPSYRFVDYEWLTNTIWSVVFPKIGMSGLAFIYTLMALSCTWIALPGRYKKHWLLVSLPAWSVIVLRFGVRPQVLSWFFLAIVTRFIYEEDLWKKWRWLFPVLMLFWGNLHGSYFLGLGVLGSWLLAKMVFEKYFDAKDWIWWVLGAFTTLINPYGIRNWQEVLVQMSQSSLFRRTIAEWQPFYYSVDLSYWLIALFSVIMLWKFWQKVDTWKILMFGGIFWYSASSLRHMPLLLIIAAPLVAELAELLLKEAEKFEGGEKRFRIFYEILVGLALFICIGEMFLRIKSADVLSERNFYPMGAVSYIKENGHPGRIFAEYRWGGYLIWKLSEERLFIDGRMPGFKQTARPGESENAFDEYEKMVVGDIDLAENLSKYGVKTVIWTLTDSSYQKKDFLVEWWEKTFPPKSKKEYITLEKRLTEAGWKKVFEDQTAVVYYDI